MPSEQAAAPPPPRSICLGLSLRPGNITLLIYLCKFHIMNIKNIINIKNELHRETTYNVWRIINAKEYLNIIKQASGKELRDFQRTVNPFCRRLLHATKIKICQLAFIPKLKNKQK